ncbi:DUF3558 family protein [Mycobacteroides immunogenum]|uniref:DUF3558 domain-containing protein n=1 Tax=Mycobacteroides immunogenum TaxID=83262 RepID=A0ABR5LKG8_9MYCO|nr:DUF3558 family protein [Mycobacteroides immunogenum]KPG26222.1 hypothetical protein AN912_25580 [Mycobacteroides immunogenum]KPG26296.1 hypothetical protein AN913_21265 [Mycobacteroides immunogenum]KPG31833.1 hypothetical protein AN914_26045 [Mycobacteroides immunogenum]KPG39690.1 hypothetical protein AN915_26505 [Mycobacteroides immunogenum]KPG57303.1 hypothetical protein AN918_26570 [Mycobacteroides immunogenum]
MRRAVSLLATCAAAAGLAGCSTSTIASIDATTPAPAASSTTVTNTLPGPHPPPNDNNNGTSFDPCLAYTAAELKGWGVAPGSVEDIGVKDTVQRGCAWVGNGWEFQQLVTNQLIDTYFNSPSFPGAQAITVEGLTAAQYRKPVDDMTICYIDLPSEKASVGTIVSVRDRKAKQLIPDACTKALEIASDTAKKLPK